MNFLFVYTPLAYFIQSFWRDEAFAFLMAKKNIIQILILSAKDFSPPLHYFLLHFWMKIFGSSEVMLRSLSLVAMVVTFYFFWEILVEIFKIKSKWLYFYLLLFILNPFLNYYAFEARGYALFTATATASFYYLIKNRNKPYVIWTVLGLYTHYFMLLALLAQTAYLFLVKLRKNERIQQFKNLVFSFLAFVPWLIFFLWYHKLANEQFWIDKPKLRTLIDLPLILYTGYESEFTTYQKFLPLFTVLLMALLIFGALLLFNKKSSARIKDFSIFYLLALWAFGPALVVLLVSYFKPIFFPRYLIFASVGVFLLLIYILEHLDRTAKTSLAILLIFFTLLYNGHQITYRKKEPIREVVRDIKLLTKKGDLLYVESELHFHAAQYYFGEEKVFIFNKSYTEIPSYVGKVLIPKEKIVYSLPAFPKKAFILKSNLNYDIQSSL